MSNHHLNLKSLIASTIFFAFTSYAQAQILFGPEEFSTPNGQLKTVVRTLDLGDNPPGTYLVRLKNGVNGPALLDQCLNKTPIELKRQCQYDNLVDRTENQLTRVSTFKIMVNGVSLSSQTLLNKASSYLEFPVNLNRQDNELKISVQGNPEAFATMQVDVMPQESLSPKALFVLNSNHGRAPFNLSYNATQSFDPQNKTITYQWFVDNQPISTTKTGIRSFTTEGEHELRLVVTNSDGLTSELSAMIVVQPALPPQNNIQPTAKMNISYPNPMNLRLVKVSALDSFDSDGFITATQITFGDGTLVNATESLHEYSSDGTYLVKVKVTDDDGSSQIIEKSISIASNNQLSKVSSAFGPGTYYGSFQTYTDTIQTFNIPANEVHELYKVRVKNADGLNHPVTTPCVGTTAEKIICAYNNLLSNTYINFNRVDYAQIYINGKRITDSASISKTKKSFETYIKLAEVNELKVRIKGWPTNYITVEVEKLGEVADTTPPVLASSQLSNTLTRSNLIHINIEDNSAVTTEVYKDNVLQSTVNDKEFSLTLTEGINNFTLKSKDSLNNQASDFTLTNIKLDTTPSTIAAPDKIQNYHFNSFPGTVVMHFEGNEELASANVNGEALEKVSATKFKYTTQVFETGLKFITTKIYDLAGNETSQNYNFNVKLDTVAPVITSTYAIPTSTKNESIRLWMKVTEDANVTNVFKVNGNVIATNNLKSPQLDFPLVEGNNVLEAISTDQAGNVSVPLTANVIRDSTGPTLTISPASGTSIGALSVNITGTSNEPLSQVKVGSQTATLSTDKLSFSYTYTTTTYGLKSLNITSKDILGNQTVQPVQYNLHSPNVPGIMANVTDNGYTNSSYISANATGSNLTNLTVLLNDIEEYNGAQTSYNFNLPGEGQYKLEIIATNSNNVVTSQIYNFTYDATAPFINVYGVQLTITEDSLPLSYSFWDASPATIQVVVNQNTIYQSSDTSGGFEIPTPSNGQYIVTISAIDAANNMSDPITFVLTKDNTPPIITIVSPLNNDYVDGNQIIVKATVDDAITSITANSVGMTWNEDEAVWQATLAAPNSEDFYIAVEATNMVHMSGHSSVTVKPLLDALIPSLVGLYEDALNNAVIIKGANGSTRPFMAVKVKTGIFSSETATADKNGSFIVSLPPKDEYTVQVNDSFTGTGHEHTLYRYTQQTILSGLVKDNNGLGLENVTVKIPIYEIETTTDSNGMFEFKRSDYPNLAISGDQKIIIDGTSAFNPDVSRPRKFSQTTLNVNLSYKQNNIIQNTIYLYPMYLDSNQMLHASGGGNFTTPEAPGVELNIAENTYVYLPNGVSEPLSMFVADVEKITVPPPKEAMPESVVVLEPSGTAFAAPVELKMPNYSNLPANTSMLIMLFNSKTGKWEAGGAARVSEDGASVVTKEDQGIMHFSMAYAMPAPADIMASALPDKPGADTFNGASTNQIDIPSFKILGQKISPSLIYKSTWAKPTATITNIFNIPEKEFIATPKPIIGSITSSYALDVISCKSPNMIGATANMLLEKAAMTGNLTAAAAVMARDLAKVHVDQGSCGPSGKKQLFYSNFDYTTEYSNLQAAITPKKVEMEFLTADIRPPAKTFKNIPRMAQLSQTVELKNQSNQYLNSGVYPYVAHYKVHYDKFITGTVESKYYQYLTDVVTKTDDVNYTVKNQWFGTDISENLYVQNYRNSEAGQGWKIGGVQKILNPNSEKIAIEEANGSLSTYAVESTIQTAVDMNSINGDLTKGISFNMWPNFTFSDKTDLNAKNATFSNGTYNVTHLGNQPQVTGTISGYTYYDWVERGELYSVPYCAEYYTWPGGSYCVRPELQWYHHELPRSTCKKNTYTYKQQPNPVQYITTSSGAYVIDHNFNSLGHISGSQYTDLISNKTNFNNYKARGQKIQNPNDPFDNNVIFDDIYANSIVNAHRGASITNTSNTRNETFEYHDACGSPQQNVPSSTGDLYQSSATGNPGSIIVSNDPNILLITSVGASAIIAYNISSATQEYITGFTGYEGDNRHISETHINGPKGLTQDPQGNIYVSSSIGQIKKINSQGIVTTIAGDPLNGLLLSEGKATEMLFNNPYGLAVDSITNSLYVADTGHHRIVKIDLETGDAKTIAGNGQAGFSGDGRPSIEASLNSPTFLHIDQNRNLVIADSGNNRVRVIGLNTSSTSQLTYASSKSDHSKMIKNSNGTWERHYRSGQIEYFNQDGLHVKSKSTNLLEINYQYDSSNRLSKVQYPTLEEINYIYSGSRLSKIVDPAGRQTNFNYNGLGQLTRVYFADNSERQFTYDSSGLLTQETNQKGFVSNYVYNELSRLQKIIFEDQNEIGIRDSVSQSAALIDESGAYTPANSTNNKEEIVDPKGNIVKTTKDVNGHISSVIDPRGRVRKIKRDLDGRPIELTDVDGSVIQHTYDSIYGDIIQTKNVSIDAIEQTTYNIFGQITSVTDTYGKIATKEYDSKRQLIRETSPDGKYTQYAYNSLGLVTNKSSFTANDQLHTAITYEYDLRGRVTKQTDLAGKFTSYSYDDAGNVISSTSNINSGTAATTTYEYDTVNRLIKVVSPKNEITEYSYSPANELLEIKDPNNKITSFAYNTKGNLISKTDPNGYVTSMTYDPNGNLLTETGPNNQTKTYSYNEINKITQLQTADDLILYAYNLKDEVIGISNTTSSIQYVRDAKQRIVQEQVTGIGISYPTHTIDINYSKNDLRISLNSPFQSLSYDYNPYNYQLTSIQNNYGDQFGFGYDTAGRLAFLTRPGSRSDFAYSTGSNLTNIVHSADSVVKSSLEYQFDLRNYITQKRSLSSTLNYVYDSNGQLTSTQKVENPSDNELFSYDALGNRLTYNGTTSAYDPTGQKILDDGSYTYLHDNNGNVTHKSSKSGGISYAFEYSALNQLKKATIVSAPISGTIVKTIEYKYDPAGRRIGKQLTDYIDSSKSYTKKYYYDGSNVIAEVDEDNNLAATYVYSPLAPDDILSARFTAYAVSSSNGGSAISEGQVLAQSQGHVYYLKDHLNTVTDIITSAGNIVQRYDYSSYGKIRSIKNAAGMEVDFNTAPVRTIYTFTGREYEPETGLYYYRARYMDASTGRFLQKDPDPGSLESPASFINKYYYAAGNPILNNDPTGEVIPVLAIGLIAATVGLSYGFIAGSAAYESAKKNGLSHDQAMLIGITNGLISAGAITVSIMFPHLSIYATAVGSGLTNAINQKIAHGSVDFGRVTIATLIGAGSSYVFGRLVLPQGMDKVAAAILGTTAGSLMGFCMNDGLSKEPNYMCGIKTQPKQDTNLTPRETMP